jgi:hypothetical protein
MYSHSIIANIHDSGGLLRSEDKLTDCSYHETESSTFSTISSTDITISCSKTTDNQMGDDTADDESSQRASGAGDASLLISALLAIALVVAVLIVCFVLWRRRKTIESPLSPSAESVALDNKMAAEDLETESYEQVEPPNILQLPPKSHPKRANPQNIDTAHCSRE